MFLLLRPQTIPAQTALSGANPISRRIAELSGPAGGGFATLRPGKARHGERGGGRGAPRSTSRPGAAGATEARETLRSGRGFAESLRIQVLAGHENGSAG